MLSTNVAASFKCLSSFCFSMTEGNVVIVLGFPNYWHHLCCVYVSDVCGGCMHMMVSCMYACGDGVVCVCMW